MGYMTNIKLVEKAKWVATLPTLYVNAAFGAPMTDANKARYVTNSNNAYNKNHAKQIMAAQANVFGFDCAGLYKSIMWNFSGDTKKSNGGAQYKSNNVPDYNEVGFKKACKISTDWKAIKIGALLFMKGHMGIYIGNGLAIEATPIWANGVQYSAVGNIGAKAGYHTRTWECWGLSPYNEYIEEQKEEDEVITDIQIKDQDTGEIKIIKGIYKDGKNYLQLSDLSDNEYALVGWDGQYPVLGKVRKCCCGI